MAEFHTDYALTSFSRRDGRDTVTLAVWSGEDGAGAILSMAPDVARKIAAELLENADRVTEPLLQPGALAVLAKPRTVKSFIEGGVSQCLTRSLAESAEGDQH